MKLTFTDIQDVTAHNLATEAAEIEWLKTHPDKVFLYVGTIQSPFGREAWTIHTWMGTILDPDAWIGPRRNVGFGYHTYRRAVRCHIFGVQYCGWYMESSGDYCRLKRSKK